MVSKADKGPQVMHRLATAVTGDHGVEICRRAFHTEFGWIFRELDERDDYGIDGLRLSTGTSSTTTSPAA